jgi:hypothetical protein
MKHKNVRKTGYAPAVAAVTAFVSAASPYMAIASGVMQAASFFQQKKATGQAAEATSRQADLQNRLNDVNAQRQRVAQLRESRIRRSQIITDTAGAGLGPTGTSSSVGAIGAVTTQRDTNINTIDTQGGFGRAIGEAGSEAYTAMGEAKGWSDIGKVSGSIFDMAGGFKAIKTLGT